MFQKKKYVQPQIKHGKKEKKDILRCFESIEFRILKIGKTVKKMNENRLQLGSNIKKHLSLISVRTSHQ